MIVGFVNGQMLKLNVSGVVADTINYLTARFTFQTSDWDGLEVWAHFAKGGATYDIRLDDGQITQDMRLNLSAGKWQLYLHGNRYDGGTVIQRVTTEIKTFDVIPTGTLDGEPFPTVPPSAGEQIIASAEAAEAGAKKAAAEARRAADKAAQYEPEVFPATFGVTTYEEVRAANDAGKLCVCFYPPLACYAALVQKTVGTFEFIVPILGNKLYTFTLDTDGRWVYRQTTQITTTNIVQSVDETSSDTKIPSAKAVYDAIKLSGGGGGVVRLSGELGAFVCSHTPAEIAGMAQTGAVVLMWEDGSVLPLQQCDGESAMFAGTVLLGDSLVAIQITVTADGVDYGAQEYNVSEMSGATASTPGAVGTVPAPAAGQQNHVLHGDGTWRAVDASGAVRYDAAQELTDIQQTTARLNIGAAAGITADASGEVLALTDSADAPLRGLCVYGKSVQDGTPTPDAPVEIVSVGADGVTEVQALGANLIPFPYYTKDVTRQGIKWTVNPDGSVTANGTATASSYFVLTSGIEWYTSGFSTSNGVKTLNGITFGLGLHYNSGNKQMYVYVAKDETVNNKTFYPMANYGKTILPYEPYTAQTLTIATPNGLCGIPVTSGGNYTDADGQQWICDTVDFSRGVRVQRIGKIGSYSGEPIDAPYISSTGELSEGAEVLYILAEPIETPLTADELAAYRALHMNYPNTTICADDNAGLTAAYAADTKNYIDRKFTELQNAILSTGGNV